MEDLLDSNLNLMSQQENDKFLIPNLLTGHHDLVDIANQLGETTAEEAFWQTGLTSSDIDQITCNALIDEFIATDSDSQSLLITPPDTPPSSDRSSPPTCSDYSFAASNSPSSSVYSEFAPSVYPDSFLLSPQPPHQLDVVQNVTSAHHFNNYIGHQQVCSPPANLYSHNRLQTVSFQAMMKKPPPQLLHAPIVGQPGSNVSASATTCIVPSQGTLPSSTLKLPMSRTNRISSDSQDKLAMSNALKEARKIRNREAARNSFQKQKELVTVLESKCKDLEKENLNLKHENESLRCKVSFLERESRRLQETFESGLHKVGGKRKAISLLAVIFMLGFNIAPYSGIISGNSNTIASKPAPISYGVPLSENRHHSGRSLLWSPDESKFEVSEGNELGIVGGGKSRHKRDVLSSRTYNSTNHSANSDCQQYINKTETLRLENDLLGLVQRSSKSSKKRTSKTSDVYQKKEPKKPLPLSRMKSWLGYESDHQAVNELGLVKGQIGDGKLPFSYESLLDAIHRRDDTFYFVSLSASDHLLLPAEANKTKIRPRFSIIMPALSTVNGTGTGGVNSTYSVFTMMQIDCEVMNTKMVQIRNLLPNGNSKKATRTVGERKVRPEQLSARRGQRKLMAAQNTTRNAT